MLPKEGDRMADSVDSDLNAHSGAVFIRVYIVQPDLSVRKLGIITVIKITGNDSNN